MAAGDVLWESDRGYQFAVVEVPTAAGGIARAPLFITRMGDGSGSGVVASAPAGTQGVGEPLWTTSDLTGLRINVAASGDTTLVTATAAQTTRVHAMRLSVTAAVIVQIKDGAGTVLEVFNFAANGGGIILDFRGRPWYKTTANTALIINLSAAVQVDGRLEYVKTA